LINRWADRRKTYSSPDRQMGRQIDGQAVDVCTQKQINRQMHGQTNGRTCRKTGGQRTDGNTYTVAPDRQMCRQIDRLAVCGCTQKQMNRQIHGQMNC
jgi:hypothetical protein